MGRLVKLMLVATVLFAVLFITFGEGVAAAESHKVTNVAHRGASGYAPENTMAAFAKAKEMNADYIELDVQMSKDGHLVIMHDTTVDRTTDGTGKVGDLTLAELRQLDAGSWFSPNFAGEKVPTFDEVLDHFGGKMGILIELKDPALYPGVERKVAAALRARNLDKPKNKKIIVQSFDHESVQIFRRLLPRVPVGVLIRNNPNGISDWELAMFSTYADYVNPNRLMVDAQLTRRIHQFGMRIWAWTVRKPEEAVQLKEAGVDGIITDYPDYVR